MMVKQKKSDADFIRQKAIELLHFLGNKAPSKKQLTVCEQLINCWVMPISIHFKQGLSPREKTCLWYAAKGFSTQKTAEFMDLKYKTVKRYRANIFKKLNCHSILEAIIKSGLLAVSTMNIDSDEDSF